MNSSTKEQALFWTEHNYSEKIILSLTIQPSFLTKHKYKYAEILKTLFINNTRKLRICGFPHLVSSLCPAMSNGARPRAETDSFLAQFGTTLIASA